MIAVMHDLEVQHEVNLNEVLKAFNIAHTTLSMTINYRDNTKHCLT